jgi:hypothetical protein
VAVAARRGSKPHVGTSVALDVFAAPALAGLGAGGSDEKPRRQRPGGESDQDEDGDGDENLRGDNRHVRIVGVRHGAE